MDHPSKPQRGTYRVIARGAAAFGVALAAIACSATADEHATSRTQHIAGGTTDVSHHSVFLLVSHLGDSGGQCTATLIAPNLLLTARHCVSPGTGDDHVLCGDSVLGDPYPPSAFITTNDPHPGEDSPVFTAVDVRVPGLGEDTCGFDVALVILKQNVPTQISMPAVPRIDREVEPGELYTAVGYGLNAAGDSTGSRMQLGGLSIECEPGNCGEGVESTEFRGETGICSGDSGGPALDVDGKVVGVVSRGGPDCSTPVYSTVTAWHEFLVETAKDAALLGGYEAPFWVTTGSSDPPVVAAPIDTGQAGAANEPRAASQGEPCSASLGCQSGLLCYAPDSGATGTCSETCSSTSQCGDGLACQALGDVSVCALPRGGADESGGCSLSSSRAPSPRSLAGLLLASLGTMLAMARRRSFRSR